MDESNICPLVSVITLVYRNSKNLAGTLDSVFSQDYKNIELIISDDCSEDFDIEYFRTYAAKNKSKNITGIKTNQNQNNLGTTAHANLAIKMSEGKYVKFLACGDEFYAPDSLSKLIVFLENCGADILNTPVVAVDGVTGKPHHLYPSKAMLKKMNAANPTGQFAELSVRNTVGGAGAVFTRKLYDDQGGFDETYRLTEDWPFWLQLCRNGHKIFSVDAVCVKYLLGGISTSSKVNPDLYQEMALLLQKEVLPYMRSLPKDTQRESGYVYMKALLWPQARITTKLKLVLTYPDVTVKRLFALIPKILSRYKRANFH